LTRPLRLDVQLELDFASVFFLSDFQRAAALAEAAAERARVAGDEAGEALARVVAAANRLWFAADADVDELEALAVAALPVLERAGDHSGLARVWDALGFRVANSRGRNEEMAHASEQADRHRRLAGQPVSGLASLALVGGPRPADEALRAFDRALAEGARPTEMLLRAFLLAMLGRFGEAWPLAHEANDRLRAMRGEIEEVWLAEIATLEGDHEAAARYLRRAYETAKAVGSSVSEVAPRLGRVLCALGRHHEAEPLAELGREASLGESDVWAEMIWRRVQALVHAYRGNHAEAELLGKEAVAISNRTDALNAQGDALCDLAEVLSRAGRTDEAAATLEHALERYERKKNLAMLAQVRPKLEELRKAAPA